MGTAGQDSSPRTSQSYWVASGVMCEAKETLPEDKKEQKAQEEIWAAFQPKELLIACVETPGGIMRQKQEMNSFTVKPREGSLPLRKKEEGTASPWKADTSGSHGSPSSLCVGEWHST